MAETSARLNLPLLVPGQAQKELFHNEALAAIDLALQASVVAMELDTPPVSPIAGQCWIVGASPTGDWAGQAGALAGWTTGGWRFIAPVEGMAVWDGTARQVARWSAGRWASGAITGSRLMIGGVQVVGAQAAPIAPAAGGATIDLQLRAVVESILTAMEGHGLIAS